MKSLKIAVLILLFSTSFCYNVEFFVKDEFGKPIENATIRIQTYQLPKDPVTDCNGYTSAELPYGIYVISVKKGNREVSKTVTISSDIKLEFSIPSEYSINVEPVNGSVLVFRNKCYKTFTSNKETFSGYYNDKFEFIAVERALVIFEKWEFDNKVSYNSYLELTPNKNLNIRVIFRDVETKLKEILNELKEIYQILNSIKNDEEKIKEKISEIDKKLEKLVLLYEKISNKLEIIEKNVSNIYSLVFQINDYVQKISELVKALINEIPNIKNELSKIEEKIESFNHKILNKLNELKNLIVLSKDEIILTILKKMEELKDHYPSKVDESKEKYCLQILNDDYEKLYSNNFILLIKNCGKENVTNIKVIVKFLENIVVRNVDIIYPNEIKYVIFQLDKKLNSYEINIYIFSPNISISKNIRISFSRAIVEIDVPEIKLKNNKTEFYIKLTNFGKEEVTDILKIEAPLKVFVEGEGRITLMPYQEKYVKIKIESFEERDFEIKFSFAGSEVIKKVYVEKKTNFELIYLIIVILIFSILIVIILKII
jgi:hypothetical protein